MSYYTSNAYASKGRSYGSYARSGAKTVFKQIPMTWWLIIAVFAYGYIKGKNSGSWFGWLFGSSSEDTDPNQLPPDEFFDSDNVPSENYTITVEEARDYADDLLDAFNTVNTSGTDLPVLMTIITNINHWDLGLIHEQFGTPNYFLVGSGGGILGTGEPMSLKDWIVEEVDTTEPEYIEFKKKYKKINIHLP